MCSFHSSCKVPFYSGMYVVGWGIFLPNRLSQIPSRRPHSICHYVFHNLKKRTFSQNLSTNNRIVLRHLCHWTLWNSVFMSLAVASTYSLRPKGQMVMLWCNVTLWLVKQTQFSVWLRWLAQNATQTGAYIAATNPHFNDANDIRLCLISVVFSNMVSDRGLQRILKRGLHFCLPFKTMQHVLERLRSGDKQKRKGHGSTQDEKLLPLPNSQHLFILRSFATPRLQASLHMTAILGELSNRECARP